MFGWDELRPGLAEAAQAVREGRDTLAVMPTGYGKSAVYQLAGLLLGGVTVYFDDEGYKVLSAAALAENGVLSRTEDAVEAGIAQPTVPSRTGPASMATRNGAYGYAPMMDK